MSDYNDVSPIWPVHNDEPDPEVVKAVMEKSEALKRARSLIDRQPCTTDMQIQVIKDLITIEELRRDWGV